MYEKIALLDFSEALKQLKKGKKVFREGWNGKGMFIFLNPGSQIEVTDGRPLADNFEVGTACEMLPCIMMKTAGDSLKLIPWLASQTDILSSDWDVFGA